MYDENEFGALLTNLSKVFDCIDHTLLIAKLFWYRVSPTALNLILSYLTNRTQRIKNNYNFSRRSIIEIWRSPRIGPRSIVIWYWFNWLILLMLRFKYDQLCWQHNSICLRRKYTGCNIGITIISFYIVEMVWKQPHEIQPREVSYFAKQ